MIEPFDQGSVFSIIAVRPFKSQFGTIVTHLTIVINRENLNVFDGEGNRIGGSDLVNEDIEDVPIEIHKILISSDLVFMVVSSKSLQSYRVRTESVKDTSAKAINITREWVRTLDTLNLTAPIK